MRQCIKCGGSWAGAQFDTMCSHDFDDPPEPTVYELDTLSLRDVYGRGRPERVFAADGHGAGVHVHPTREGAIALWQAKWREKRDTERAAEVKRREDVEVLRAYFLTPNDRAEDLRRTWDAVVDRGLASEDGCLVPCPSCAVPAPKQSGGSGAIFALWGHADECEAGGKAVMRQAFLAQKVACDIACESCGKVELRTVSGYGALECACGHRMSFRALRALGWKL